MTLFDKPSRKSSKKSSSKVSTMMAEESIGGDDVSGASSEPTSSTVVNMDVPEDWMFQVPASQGYPGIAPEFGHDEEGSDGSSGLSVRLPGQAFFVPPPHLPSSGHHHGNIHGEGPQGQPAGGSSPMETVKGFFESSLPFIVLLLIKISFDHRTGIMLFLAMYGTFVHCNGKAMELILPVKLRARKDFYRGSLLILSVAVVSITLLYYTFADQHLYKSLYLVIPDIQPVDIWGMAWIVGATDFVIKFGTVALKLLMAFLPVQTLCRRKRGQLYQIIEVSSQFYRSLVPITPWVYFLLDRSGGRGYWLSLFLLTAYITCKSLELYKKMKEIWSSLLVFVHGLAIGTAPSKSHLDSMGSSCAICHDLFSDPVMLNCTHIFCEECIMAWFDRERTCPMCRSKVQQAPRWRDGRTSSSIQFF